MGLNRCFPQQKTHLWQANTTLARATKYVDIHSSVSMKAQFRKLNFRKVRTFGKCAHLSCMHLALLATKAAHLLYDTCII